MTETRPLSGVYCPALTPMNADLSLNTAAFIEHCRWLLDDGCHGLAVFGTTSGASLRASSLLRLQPEMTAASATANRKKKNGLGMTPSLQFGRKNAESRFPEFSRFQLPQETGFRELLQHHGARKNSISQ